MKTGSRIMKISLTHKLNQTHYANLFPSGKPSDGSMMMLMTPKMSRDKADEREGYAMKQKQRAMS